MIWISLILVLVVAASSTGVMLLFFRRLHRIESELWGEKSQEAEDTAQAATADANEEQDTDNA